MYTLSTWQRHHTHKKHPAIAAGFCVSLVFPILSNQFLS